MVGGGGGGGGEVTPGQHTIIQGKTSTVESLRTTKYV